MLISALAVEHKNELDRINSDFEEKCNQFTEMEKSLRDAITELEKELTVNRKKLQYAEGERKRLLEIVEENIITKEKEVKLRVEFEHKINNMHALNRVTQERYDRAIQDVGECAINNYELPSNIDEFKTRKEQLEQT